MKICSLPSHLSPFHSFTAANRLSYSLCLTNFHALSPCYSVTAFSVLKKLFSAGCQLTFNCWDILNFSLNPTSALRHCTKNWKVQQFNFAVDICLQQHSVQANHAALLQAVLLRNQVRLVTVIIYSAKSLPTNSRYLFPATSM